MPTSLQLVSAYADQDTRFETAYRVLRDAIASRAFPAASVSITTGNNLLGLRAFGRFTFEPQSSEITPDTIFDLASVSKVIATTTMSAILYERGLLEHLAFKGGTMLRKKVFGAHPLGSPRAGGLRPNHQCRNRLDNFGRATAH